MENSGLKVQKWIFENGEKWKKWIFENGEFAFCWEKRIFENSEFGKMDGFEISKWEMCISNEAQGCSKSIVASANETQDKKRQHQKAVNSSRSKYRIITDSTVRD